MPDSNSKPSRRTDLTRCDDLDLTDEHRTEPDGWLPDSAFGLVDDLDLKRTKMERSSYGLTASLTAHSGWLMTWI